MLYAQLFVHFNGHIRADQTAHRAAGAFFGIIENHKVVAFFVESFSNPDHFLGTGIQAKLAPLTSFFIDDDLSHIKNSVSVSG